MKVTTGNLEVLEAGVARTGFTNNIKFDFGSIWVEFTFIINSDDEYRAEYVPAEEDANGLRVNIYNNSDIHGAGITRPIRIGSLDDRELWLTYRSFRVSKEHDSWSLEYIFFKGDEVNEQN